MPLEFDACSKESLRSQPPKITNILTYFKFSFNLALLCNVFRYDGVTSTSK